MTEYTLRVPTAMRGDVIALVEVSEAMARHAATGYGTLPLHGPTLKNLRLIHTMSLLSEARAGRLLVCNQVGYQGTVDEIIDAAKNSGDLSESRRYLVEPDSEKLKRENPPVVAGSDVWDFSGIDLGATETDWDMTHLLTLYVRKKHLIEWGNANGDVFHIVDAPVIVTGFGPKDEYGDFAYRGMIRKDELRTETTDAQVETAPAAKVKAGTPITIHKLRTKNMPLDAEIATAKTRALDNTNVQSVWDELVKMANKQEGCLIGEGDLNELQYGSRQDPPIFTKGMLADRMRGRKNRAKPR